MKRTAVLLPLLAAWLAFPGCGDRSLMLTVNLLSFLDPADRTEAYGPIPPGVAVSNLDVASQEVNLLEGLGDAVDVASASLRIGVRFENQTGSASGSLRVYIAPGDSADPYSVPPLADVPVTLAPSDTAHVATEIASSPALAAALTQSRAKVAVRISFDTTGSLAPLQGSETIEELLAIVVTKRSL
ncbi:MAG TPA: hypothetical protein VID50_11770 [Candidatus Eisenbacteria bacterium]